MVRAAGRRASRVAVIAALDRGRVSSLGGCVRHRLCWCPQTSSSQPSRRIADLPYTLAMNRDTTYSGEMRAVSLRTGLKLHQTKEPPTRFMPHRSELLPV